MTKIKRRLATGGFAVACGVMALTSAAFACLQFQGKMTASGNGTGNSLEEVWSDGGFMSVCSIPTGTAKVKAGVGNAILNITVAPSTDPCTPAPSHTQLPDGVYDVLTDPGTGADACRNPNTLGGTSTGEVIAVTGGAGTTGALPATWTAKKGVNHVCVSLPLAAGLGYKGIATFIESV